MGLVSEYEKEFPAGPDYPLPPDPNHSINSSSEPLSDSAPVTIKLTATETANKPSDPEKAEKINTFL